MTNVESIKARLLAEVETVWLNSTRTSRVRNPDGPEAVAMLDALVAENEQFIAALRVIADTPNAGWMIARKALKDAARD